MISPKRVVLVPARAAYTATRCWDCPHWVQHGAPYGDGSICSEDELNDIRTTPGDDMPDWCPLAVAVPEELAPEVYCVERTGDIYQSVFPSEESELSQLHSTLQDALDYFQEVKPGVHVEVPDELA